MVFFIINFYIMILSYIPTVAELSKIPIEDNGEKMVPIPENEDFKVSYHNSQETVDLVGRVMLVREGVLERLKRASEKLASGDPNLSLWVYYAYRPLSVQSAYYESALEEVKAKYPDSSLGFILQSAHILAAEPSVAGHPTGAAVDMGIYNERLDTLVDMGVSQNRADERAAGLDYIRPDYRGVSEEVFNNRMLLREVMSSAGFAPFNGEFWHFSFGDSEWAAFTGAQKAIYGQLSVEDLDLESLR